LFDNVIFTIFVVFNTPSYSAFDNDTNDN